MPSYVPPLRSTQYIEVVELTDVDYNTLASPTISTGDFQISGDFGTFNNLATLPTVVPVASGQVMVTLSATEMSADNIFLRWTDPDGEWIDGALVLQTVPAQFGEFEEIATIVGGLWDVPFSEIFSTFGWESATVRQLLSWLAIVATHKHTQTANLGILRNVDDNVNVAIAEAARGVEMFTRGKFG